MSWLQLKFFEKVKKIIRGEYVKKDKLLESVKLNDFSDRYMYI